MAESEKVTEGQVKAIRKTLEHLSQTVRSVKFNQEQLPTAVRKIAERSKTAEFRFAKLRLHGKGSLAYSSMQKGIKYYMLSEYGYVAYTPMNEKGDAVVVLADPVCHHEHKRALLSEFVKATPEPIFIHISKDTAEILHDFGFYINQLGMETIIDIQTFDLVGNKKQQLRSARNHAIKDGLSVVEVLSVDDAMLKQLKKVSDDWMKECVVGNRELQFLVRPIVFVDEEDVRKFVAIKDGKIVGFVFFDPMYSEGEISGYIANHLRSNLDRSYSVTDFIILQALEKFKAEGKKDLSLGLSPLYKVADTDDFRHSKFIREHFKYCFQNANFLYSFQNLAHHKTKYRPGTPGAREEQVYCAMKTAFSLSRLYGIYRVLGLNPVAQTLEHIKRKIASWFKPSAKDATNDS